MIVTTLPGRVMASNEFTRLTAVGVTSYRVARRRISHERWWRVHLFTYLAIILSFSRRLSTGATFVSNPLARLWWIGLYAVVGGSVVWYRVLVPVWRSAYHRLQI